MKKKWTSLFGVQDLTAGKPMTGLLQFSIPLLIGNFAQQLYNTVDSIVVGQKIGDKALSAVGASGPVLNLLLVLFVGVATGAGIMVAQYFGAKDRKMLSKTVGTALILTLFVSLALSAVGVLAAPWLLELLGTPTTFLKEAQEYLVIIFLGFTGMAFYNIISGILRGMGDSVYPLIYLIFSTLMNVVLDIWFVSATGKVAGVAWATIIAQGISSLLCLRRLLKMKETLDINRKTLRISKSLSARLFKLGIPAGITQAVFSLSALLVQSLANSLEVNTGLPIIAAQTAVMRVDGFCMMPNMTFGNAATTFVGQNIGAGRMDRVKQGTRDAMKLGLGASTFLTLLILFFGSQLMSLFTQNEEVIRLGSLWMRILAAGYIAFSVTQVLSGVMRGAGETMIPMWISMINTVVVRMSLAYGLVEWTKSPALPYGNPDCLQYSLLIAWVCGAAFTTLAYFKSRWRERAVLPKINEEH